ncbi:MAG: phosphoenolpyruvate carboxykinase [Hyphomicrobiaceae bacterium]
MSSKRFEPASTATLNLNASADALYGLSVDRGEARVASTGALAVETGQHTGRSASDKFLVRDGETETTVWWDNAASISAEQFDRLYDDFTAHTEGKDLFVQDLFGGADPVHRLSVRVFTEYAWHALFIRYLLRRPGPDELNGFEEEFTVVCLPSFRADPARHGVRTETVIACDLTRKIVLIGGTSYAGEMKKSVFSFLNYVLPTKGVMPMHCSANVGRDGDSAVFFGLSGTGKTTLSNDPARQLIGDDEHGWSENGIFNFEGGCYAKTINLSPEAEPLIWKATNRKGTVLENVVLEEGTLKPDYDDISLTPNARSAYPMDYVENASETARAGHPKTIVMLCADAFGVLPPIARLSPSQAMYHFLSGYTAKVAGTEKGMGNEPVATFSTCFGAPFMARHPSEYGNLLRKLIAEHDVSCWLVNTGWTGGKYGEGHRMPIAATRRLLDAALSGELDHQAMRTDALFGFQVPIELDGVDAAILHPRTTWADPRAYDRQAQALVAMFNDNFEMFASHVDADVQAAAPMLQEAAE